MTQDQEDIMNAQQLLEFRKQHHVTRSALARWMDRSDNTLWRWETGKVSPPRIATELYRRYVELNRPGAGGNHR